MKALLRDKTTAIWALLVAATLTSWLVGAGHGIENRQAMTAAVLFIALMKGRLVGLYFMELRTAPMALRFLFEAWVVVTYGVVIGIYLVA